MGLSASIVAMNEEDRLPDCLRSLDFCDEIVVVDSHSTDRTREIARDMGARVIERDWNGFRDQKEFAVRASENDWVLCLDADERVTAELRDEIVALRDGGFPDLAGWTVPRLSNYLGTWIRHGTWYPNRQLRLYDRRRGRWEAEEPHPKVVLQGPIGELKGDLEHYPYRSFEEHLRSIDGYTTTMAQALRNRGKRVGVRHLIVNPALRFFRFYVLKRGFLLGWKGLLLAFLAAHYVRLKYAKVLLMQRGDVSASPATPKEREASA